MFYKKNCVTVNIFFKLLDFSRKYMGREVKFPKKDLNISLKKICFYSLNSERSTKKNVFLNNFDTNDNINLI